MRANYLRTCGRCGRAAQGSWRLSGRCCICGRAFRLRLYVGEGQQIVVVAADIGLVAVGIHAAVGIATTCRPSGSVHAHHIVVPEAAALWPPSPVEPKLTNCPLASAPATSRVEGRGQFQLAQVQGRPVPIPSGTAPSCGSRPASASAMRGYGRPAHDLPPPAG